MIPDPDNQRRFDRQMQQLHAAALAQVSPQVRARLRAARHATTPRHAGGWRWLAATACSAVLAVAIGMQFHATAPPAPAGTPPSDDGNYDNLAVLEENPELYVWLGSDGHLLAQE